MTTPSERELKVSELQPGMIVALKKPPRLTAFMRVMAVGRIYVWFCGSTLGSGLIAARQAHDPETIVDDDGLKITIYEGLGHTHRGEAP